MKISLITDEISADPETAIELGAEWGIRDFELRGYFTERAPLLSAYQKQRLRDLLVEYQARIIAIGPGLFKIPFPIKPAARQSLAWLDRSGYEDWAKARRRVYFHLNELLPATLDYANELGASSVVVFGFDRVGQPPGEPPEEILDCLRQAAEKTAAAGLELVLENEAGFWADTGARCAQILRSIDHPALGANWDPGNAFFAGDEPFPSGYEQLKSLVRHVHFKDALRDPSGEYHYVLDGQIDWAGQIQALADDGYSGYLSVETHARPKVAAARYSLQRLRSLMSAAGIPDVGLSR